MVTLVCLFFAIIHLIIWLMEFQSLNAMSFDAEHIVTKGDTGVERIRQSSLRYGSFLLLGTKKDFETDYVIYDLSTLGML